MDQRLRDLERKHRENPNDEDVGQELFRERLRGVDLAELVMRRLARMERILTQGRAFLRDYRGKVSYRELNELLARDLDKPKNEIGRDDIARGSGSGMGVGGRVAVIEVNGDLTNGQISAGDVGGDGQAGDPDPAITVASSAGTAGGGAAGGSGEDDTTDCGCFYCRELGPI